MTMAFISHSSKDKTQAVALVQALRTRNNDCWIDHERIGFCDSIPDPATAYWSSRDRLHP